MYTQWYKEKTGGSIWYKHIHSFDSTRPAESIHAGSHHPIHVVPAVCNPTAFPRYIHYSFSLSLFPFFTSFLSLTDFLFLFRRMLTISSWLVTQTPSSKITSQLYTPVHFDASRIAKSTIVYICIYIYIHT